MSDSWVSIEEAAERIGRSVATVRRWAADGVIRAEKRGKSWTVDVTSIGQETVTAAVRPSSLTGVDLDKAWVHLRQQDLKTPWVPDVLAMQDHIADSLSVKAGAARRLEGPGPFDPAIPIEMPKGPLLTRNGTMLSIEDNLAYQAAVESIADRINRALPDTVFSARLDPDDKTLLKEPRLEWVRFSAAVLEHVRDPAVWLINTDLVSYYDTIPHRQLFSDIDFLNPDPGVGDALKRMLGAWSGDRTVGVPQGPEVSSILANLYLLPVDQALQTDDWLYFRYMDDIRIVATSRRAALDGLRRLERETRRRGLLLSAVKTAQLRGPSAVASIEREKLNDAAYAWQSRGQDVAVPLVREILRDALNQQDPDAKSLRFSLNRLRAVSDLSDVKLILGKLDRLGHVARLVAQYLWPALTDSAVVAEVESYLRDPDRNVSTFMECWLLGSLIDGGTPPPAGICTYARRAMKDRNQPGYLRVLAANLLVLAHHAGDVAWIRGQLASEFDPSIIRGYLVALSRADRLDTGAVRQIVARIPTLGRTVRYLQNSKRMPSLVYQRPPPQRQTVKF